MFYIDFTSPEGKTYRIDLSKHKLIHSCPICGSEQQIMLDESDPYYWCEDCRERREEQEKEQEREKKERYKKHMEENVRRINKMCHSNIDIGTLEQWGIEAQLKGLSVEEEVAFFKEKINQLRSN